MLFDVLMAVRAHLFKIDGRVLGGMQFGGAGAGAVLGARGHAVWGARAGGVLGCCLGSCLRCWWRCGRNLRQFGVLLQVLFWDAVGGASDGAGARLTAGCCLGRSSGGAVGGAGVQSYCNHCYLGSMLVYLFFFFEK